MNGEPLQESQREIPHVRYAQFSIFREVLLRPVLLHVICLIILLLLVVFVPVALYWLAFVIFK